MKRLAHALFAVPILQKLQAASSAAAPLADAAVHATSDDKSLPATLCVSAGLMPVQAHTSAAEAEAAAGVTEPQQTQAADTR
jgi:hypothetical protein